MKKLLAILLSVIMVLSLVACGNKTQDETPSNDDQQQNTETETKTIKVGLICIGDENDQGYTYNFIRGKEAATEALAAKGINVDWVVKYNIGEDSTCEDANIELAEEGCELIFNNSYGFEPFMLKVAPDYPEINYLIKMNSKTNLVKGSQDDPYSPQLYDLEAVLAMREAGVNIVGLGYTIYLGSEYESTMMAEAGELIAEAHAAGLLVVLWIYPRGKAVADEKDPDLIAGAAGVALCLGADFVKVNPPHEVEGQTSAEGLAIASKAAGRTGLVCAGGSKADANVFLTELHNQIHIGGACGNATGRNIHMRSTEEAIRLCNAISAITLGDWSVEDAEAVFRGEKTFAL